MIDHSLLAALIHRDRYAAILVEVLEAQQSLQPPSRDGLDEVLEMLSLVLRPYLPEELRLRLSEDHDDAWESADRRILIGFEPDCLVLRLDGKLIRDQATAEEVAYEIETWYGGQEAEREEREIEHFYSAMEAEPASTPGTQPERVGYCSTCRHWTMTPPGQVYATARGRCELDGAAEGAATLRGCWEPRA